MTSSRILWLVRRARKMRPGELSYRLAQARRAAVDLLFTAIRGKSVYQRDCEPASFAFCRSAKPLLPEFEWEFSPSIGAVELWLSGCHEIFGLPWRWEALPEDWHRAPDTGRLWPRRPCALIDYRPGNSVGDARTVWEPNRLQHLVAFALTTRFFPAYAERAAQAMKRRLLCWSGANPAQHGINYASALECALRILSVSIASDLARPFLIGRERYWTAASKLILEHAAIINDRISLFSSLGNHTVGECTGLLVAALLFPEAREAQAWEQKATAHLASAARAVILEDGGPAEQAFHYHAQVVDYLHIAISVASHFGRDVSELAELHRAGARFLARFGGRRDELPNIGDNDEGHVVSPHLVPSWATVARRIRTGTSPSGISCFTGGGYSRVYSAAGEAELVMDHGPLGFAPNFAHGHADALGLYLRVAGRPVLIDAGTSFYGAESEFRSYCRDTAAHNCITVDDIGQAKQAGPFLWSAPYDCRLLHADAGPDSHVLVGRHLGYEHRGVVHTRAVCVAPHRVLVFDRVRGDGGLRLALRWHFANEPVREEDLYVLADWSGFRCGLSGGDSRILHGSMEPRSGWLARRYGQMSPGWTLEVSALSAGLNEFTSAFLLPSFAGDPACTADFANLRSILDQIDPGLPPTARTGSAMRSPVEAAAKPKHPILVDG